MFNPKIENSTTTYQVLTTQIAGIVDVWGVPSDDTNNTENLSTIIFQENPQPIWILLIHPQNMATVNRKKKT
jgi:hypothetical protein